MPVPDQPTIGAPGMHLSTLLVAGREVTDWYEAGGGGGHATVGERQSG